MAKSILVRILLFLGCLVSLLACFPTDHRVVIPGSWRTVAEFPSTNGLFLTTLNGKIYAGVGGDSARIASRITKLYAFDPVSRQITQKKNFSGTPVSGFSYFALDNKLNLGQGNADPPSGLNPGIEQHYATYYQYDPDTDQWRQLPSTGQITSGAVGFTFGDKGIILNGGYRNAGGSFTTFIRSQGVVFTQPDTWTPVYFKLFGTAVYPDQPSNSFESLRALYRVHRSSGFSFTFNNRIYTGGGTLFNRAFEAITGDQERRQIVAREISEFELSGPSNGAYTITLQRIMSTPSDEFDLTGCKHTFILNGTIYFLVSDGQLLSYTPATDTWQKVAGNPGGLIAGTALNGKAYLLTKSQLLEFTP